MSTKSKAEYTHNNDTWHIKVNHIPHYDTMIGQLLVYNNTKKILLIISLISNSNKITSIKKLSTQVSKYLLCISYHNHELSHE